MLLHLVYFGFSAWFTIAIANTFCASWKVTTLNGLEWVTDDAYDAKNVSKIDAIMTFERKVMYRTRVHNMYPIYR